MNRSKITKSLAVFASVILIIIIGVASFAYFGTFSVNLNNNVAVNINSSSPGNATFIANATQLNLVVPAADMSFTVANNTVAAKEDTAYLDVTLTGSPNLLTTCTYDIVYEYNSGSNVYGQGTTTKTSGADKEITIEVNGMNGNNHFAEETNFDYANIQSYYDSTNKYYKLVENATIKSLGTEQSVRWKIIGRYYNLDVSQAQLSGKNFTGKIYAISKGCSSEDGTTVKKGYETIVANNGGSASMTTLTSTDFATVTTENDKGMYKATDDLGTSYYFRGAVDNNWVKYGKETACTFNGSKVVYVDSKFNFRNVKDEEECVSTTLCSAMGAYAVGLSDDMCTSAGGVPIGKKGTYSTQDMYWRIIRINGDNSIRMIYTGNDAPSASTSVIMTGYKTVSSINRFNTNYDSAEYVGYMYTIGEQHGTGKDSTIKTALDDWYANHTDLNKTGTKITDQIYCNDRTASTSDAEYSTTNYTTLTSWNSTGTTYYYGAYGRIAKDNNPMLTCAVDSDRFTVNKTNGKGNSALTYPVGLITIDELEMAGNNWSESNTSYYLHTGANYWAGSPYGFDSNGAYEFRVAYDGILSDYFVDYNFGVRGVVSLSSDAKLLGSGTYDDVYVVS